MDALADLQILKPKQCEKRLSSWSKDDVKALVCEAVSGNSENLQEILLAVEGCDGLEALQWSYSLLETLGVNSEVQRKQLLLARDQVIASQQAPKTYQHTVQIFGQIEYTLHPVRMLTIRDRELTVSESRHGALPDKHAETAARLLHIFELSHHVMYNNYNIRQLLKVAVKVQESLLTDGERRGDLSLSSRLASCVWEIHFWATIFACSGWLERLLYGGQAPDDGAAFEQLRRKLLRVGGFDADDPNHIVAWENSTGALHLRIANAGGVQALTSVHEKRTSAAGGKQGTSYSCIGLEAPFGKSQEAWDQSIDTEIDVWGCCLYAGPHMQIRHSELRKMWRKHLRAEEVMVEDFWSAFAKISGRGTSAAIRLVLTNSQAREIVTGQICCFGSPNTVSVLEVDLVFPPLLDLDSAIQIMLERRGWKEGSGQVCCTPLARAHSIRRRRSTEFFHSHSKTQELLAWMRSAAIGKSGVVCVEGDAGLGKHKLAAVVSRQLQAAGCWFRCYEVDLRSAISASEAADQLAAGLMAAPYCLCSFGKRTTARERLTAWAAAQCHAPPDSRSIEQGGAARCVGILITHVNRQLLEDELECGTFMDILSSLLQAFSYRDHEELCGGCVRHSEWRRTAVQMIITSQEQVNVAEDPQWFIRRMLITTDKENAAEMLNCNAPSPSEMADLEIQKALIENLSENPLALYILGSAIGSGIITAEKALEALKKRVPPAVAMGCKLQKPSGAAALEQAPAFRMEDPLRTSRGGRKQNMGSARNILHSPLARVMIVLKMQLPEHMQVALLLLSYLPTTFDLQTALQILQPVMKDSVSVVASIIRTYLNCGLLHFNHREGTFSMQASVQMIIRCLMLFADNQSPLTRACSEAIKCILETCSTVLTRASALVANGAAVTGSFYLNHHIPLFWKVQFLAQDHVLDGLAGNWLVTYLKPMVEHPAVFIQHLPAAARASFCRAMAGAAGQIGSCKSRAITLWHLGQALMEDNQVEGAVGVLNRAVDALDEPQQASRLVAPSEELELTTNLLRSQLLCALAVCSCQLDDTPKARKQAEAAVGLQQHTLRLLAAAAAPDDATRGCREESARLQLVTGLLLRGLIELRESEFSAAVLFFKEALAVVPSGEQGDGGVSNTMLRLSAAANHSLAHAQGLGGDWAAACQTLKQAAEMWLEAGTAGSNAVCDWMDCAELMHAQGRKDTARDMLRRAVAVMQDRSCIDRIRMNELWTCFRMEGAGQLGSSVHDSAQPAQGGPLKFLARILRMLTRHECGSRAPVGPPGGLVERWRQSHMMSSLPCGWTGIQGWPLSVWCGFPVESKDFTGRLLMRSITISRTWAALESKFAVETYIRQQAESSDLSQRNRKAVQKAPDPPTQPECSTAECVRKAAAGLPAELEEQLTMSDPGLRVSSATGPSSNARRRRPVGRQSSGSLSHAKSPSIQPLGQSPLRSSSRMPLDICKEAIDENCQEDD